MTDKESLTGIEQDVQVEERTKHAMETYVNWLQNAMSASPWTNVDLNKKTAQLCHRKRYGCCRTCRETQSCEEFGRRGENPDRIYEQATGFS
jgi:hypothetical protein